jgi:hypothetical protein
MPLFIFPMSLAASRASVTVGALMTFEAGCSFFQMAEKLFCSDIIDASGFGSNNS